VWRLSALSGTVIVWGGLQPPAGPLMIFVPDSLMGRSEFPQVPTSPATRRYGGERAFGYLFEGRRESGIS